MKLKFFALAYLCTTLFAHGMNNQEFNCGPTQEVLIAMSEYNVSLIIAGEIKEMSKTMTPLIIHQYALNWLQKLPNYPTGFIEKFIANGAFSWMLFPLINHFIPEPQAEKPLEIFIRKNIPNTLFNIASGEQKLLSGTTYCTMTDSVLPIYCVAPVQIVEAYYGIRDLYREYKNQK